MYLRSLLLAVFSLFSVARGLDVVPGPIIGIPQPPVIGTLYQNFTIGDPDAFRIFRSVTFEVASYPPPGAQLGTFASQNDAPTALLWGADGTLYSFAWSGEIRRLTLPENGAGPVTSEAVANLGAKVIEETLCRDQAGRLCGVVRYNSGTSAELGQGALFRFDPTTQTLETVLHFGTAVPGLPNSLICGADGAFYGTSSLMHPDNGLYTHLTPVGPDTPTGSIFRVSPTGELTVLHTFTEADKTTPALLAGLGTADLPGTFPAPTPEHPAKVYLPSSLVQTPAGDLVCWVSGGIYWLPAGGGEPRFLLAPVGVQSSDDPNYFGRDHRYYDEGLYFAPESPALHRAPDGRVHGARRSWELTLDGNTVTVAPLPVPAKMPNHIVAPRRFISADGGRFMFSGDHRIVYTDDTNTRLAADVSRSGFGLTSGGIVTVVRGECPRPGFECVYVAIERTSIDYVTTRVDYKLYRVPSSANVAPQARLDDLRAAVATYDLEDEVFEFLFDPVANDRDLNEEELTIVAVSTPAHGTVTIVDGHHLLYRTADPLQRDTFTYTVRDRRGAEGTASVVIGGHRAAAPDRFAEYHDMLPDGRLRFRAKLLDALTDADGDKLGASVVLAPPVQNAEVVPDDPLSMLITVVSADIGQTFRYQVADGRTEKTGSLRLIDPENHPPVVEDYTIALRNLQPVTVPISEIASDPNGDALSVTVASPPAHGAVAITGAAFVFTPNANFPTQDSFTLTISDGRGLPVTVHVAVFQPFARFAVPHAGFFETDAGNGLVRVTLAPAGRATVQLSIHGKVFRAKLDLATSGTGTATFRGPRGEVIQLELSVIGAEGRALAGAVIIDGERYDVDLAPRGPREGLNGQYNVVLERESEVPMHYGYAVLRLDAAGGARLSGRTPDGLPWSTGGILTDETELAVFAQVGGRTRSISGQWSIASDDDVHAVSGSLVWKRGAAEETMSIAGSRYRLPQRGLNAFGERQTVFSLNFTAPGVTTKPAQLTLGGGNAAVQPGLMTVRCTVNRANGVFSGYALLHGSPLASSFTGVLRGSEGFGVLSTKSGPGSVVLLSRDRRTLQLNTGGSVVTGGVILTGFPPSLPPILHPPLPPIDLSDTSPSGSADIGVVWRWARPDPVTPVTRPPTLDQIFPSFNPPPGPTPPAQ